MKQAVPICITLTLTSVVCSKNFGVKWTNGWMPTSSENEKSLIPSSRGHKQLGIRVRMLTEAAPDPGRFSLHGSLSKRTQFWLYFTSITYQMLVIFLNDEKKSNTSWKVNLHYLSRSPKAPLRFNDSTWVINLGSGSPGNLWFLLLTLCILYSPSKKHPETLRYYGMS